MRKVNLPIEIDGLRVVQDNNEIFKALQSGETVMHYEYGNSLVPILMDGEYCRIKPCSPEDVNPGDVVFCSFNYSELNGERKTAYMVHRCTDIIERNNEKWFKIETTSGYCYGWTRNVYGIAESTDIFETSGE